MKTHHKHVFKALGTNFELACIAAIIALVADLGWLLHDILANGLSIPYILVGSGLLIGIILTAVVIVRHNAKLAKKLDKTLLTLRLKRLHKKNKSIVDNF